MTSTEANAAARQRLLVVTGMLLEALYEPTAVAGARHIEAGGHASRRRARARHFL